MTTGPSKLERLEADLSCLLWIRVLTRKTHGLAAARDAVEAERERLRDLVGALCKRLDREVSGVYFRPMSRLHEHEDHKGALRIVYRRAARHEYVREPVHTIDFQPYTDLEIAQATTQVRVIDEQLLADDWQLDLELLAHDDEPVAVRFRHYARVFLRECERRSA